MKRIITVASLALVIFTVFGIGSSSKAGAEEQRYWINPNGGTKYHWVHHCPSIHPRYYDGMIEIIENQLNMNPS